MNVEVLYHFPRFIEAANMTTVDAPSDIDEWELSGLTRVPCVSFIKYTICAEYSANA